MFRDMEDYLKLSREERMKHLDLNAECIEIEHEHNTYLRALMAHFNKVKLNGIPNRSLVCHACNNSRCSNPLHLYWGTHSDNIIDSKEAGTFKSAYKKSIEKYGEDHHKKIMKAASSKGGKNSKKICLSEKIIKDRLKDYQEDSKKRGMTVRLSNKWKISHTQVKRFLKKYGPIAQSGRARA